MHFAVTLPAGEYCTSDSPSVEKLNRKSIFGPFEPSHDASLMKRTPQHPCDRPSSQPKALASTEQERKPHLPRLFA
jgi:hypothetical protein